MSDRSELKEVAKMNQDKLLLCPFCGEVPIIEEAEISPVKMFENNGYRLFCKCGVVINAYEKDTLSKHWNTRLSILQTIQPRMSEESAGKLFDEKADAKSKWYDEKVMTKEAFVRLMTQTHDTPQSTGLPVDHEWVSKNHFSQPQEKKYIRPVKSNLGIFEQYAEEISEGSFYCSFPNFEKAVEEIFV